ncbi:hypothetical protein [Anaeromyxobacter paludicola]|uniref:Uncharacterized protein n=1 Tax=Anaeromyxobacter paludicola TaxID=2918171 RepID=A0ABN6N2V6_9BACT|nr:hypothetical protein [Anaeromyxobacter paludicola]BDG07532.1 hypothetical protein AMPC_06450 [Anaeromyxobacter paludicola]
MILLELAAQGVKGVAPAGGRLALRPGYNVVPSADGAALARLVAALVAPGERDGEALPGVAAAPARAGATLAGKDRLTLRLVREFGRSAQLQRFDAARRAFAPLAQDLAEISRQLLAAGAPSRARFERVRMLDPADLPSRAPGAGLPRSATAAAPRPRLAPEAAAAKLAALADELERARAADRLQFQLDGLQSRLFQQEKLLEDGARLREAVAAAEAARAQLDRVAAVLAGLGELEARLAGHARAVARRDEALARAAEERGALEREAEARAPRPLRRSPVFVAGLALGALALAGGVAGALQGSNWRYLALLDVPAFGVAAWAALRAIGDLEGRERGERRRALVEEYERKAAEAYAKEAGEVDAAVTALELKGPAALAESAQRVAEADRAVEAARAALAAWEARAETRGAVEEKARAAAELARVEAAIAGQAGGYLRDARSIEAEVARVQAELARPPAPEPAAAPRPADPIGAFLAATAADGEPAGELLRAIGPRARQLAGNLSGGRLGAVLLDARGALSVEAGGRAVPAAGLPPPDQDLVYLALKLAAAEREVAGQVLVVGEVFDRLPLAARRAAAAFLKQLARAGQVLHATADPVFREAADHSA